METKERKSLRKVYDNPKWLDKVNKMSDAQCSAIYLRLKTQGKVK